MALGATQREIVRLVVFQGMSLAITGVVIGLAAAFLLSRMMRSLLFGVAASDPATFSGIALLLTSVAFLATCIPAMRAARVDPILCLRAE
jgi:putative ABC transport system permease protein